MVRKIFAMLVFCALLFVPNIAGAESFYKSEEVINIAPGITLTKVREDYSGYELTYSYITADFDDKNIGLTLLKSEKGINERETVLNLAKTEENVVAAINCDFFAMSSESFSQGIEYKDGKLLQSPIDTNAFAGGFLYEKDLLFSNIDFHIVVTAPNGAQREVYRLNKPMNLFGELLMYTPDYEDGFSPAPGGGVVEMFVSDGVVVGFNRTKEPVKIPEDGYVLLISDMYDFISANFKEGDEVKIDYNITPTLENLTMAFGGGTVLLKDGEIAPFTNNITGYNPRSAVGTDKSGKKLYLLSVDGRQNTSRGLTQTELANLLKEIGCTEALNLDGGGSTNMVTKTYEKEGFVTANSPTENRKVINALGITSLAKSDGKLKKLTLKAEAENVFKGESVGLSLFGADSAYSYVEIDKEDVKFNIKNVSDMKFSSDKGGRYEVYATYKGIKSNSVYINVISDISGIDISPKITMDKETYELNINVFDQQGRYVKAPFEVFDILVEGEAAEFDNGKLIAKEAGEAILKVSYGDVCAFSKIIVNMESEEEIKRCSLPQNILKDEAEKDIENPDFAFSYTAAPKEENTLFDRLYIKKAEETVLKYDVGAVLGRKNSDKYECTRKDGALFINLPTKNGFVRSADTKALDSLKKDIISSDEKNIFITTEGYFDMDGREIRAIINVLKETGKGVYVISKGEANGVKIIDGIRFFTIADNYSYVNLTDAVENIKMLVFNVQNDEVSYSFKNIY